MAQLLWDASGLAKRFVREIGSETVDALYTAVTTTPMLITYMGYAETAAILRRSRNRGDISENAFLLVRTALENEVLLGENVALLSVSDAHILNGIVFSDRHNINSTDAAILAAFLDYVQSLDEESPACILVSADRHLLRAAQLEGLVTLNPELLPAEDVPLFLAGFP